MTKDQARLSAAVEVSKRAAARLRMSVTKDRSLLEPRAARAGEEDVLRAIDAFVQRYQQLVEHMTRRLYPSIFRVAEGGDRPPALTTLLDYLEGIGVLSSERDWLLRLEVRNRLVHEYPLDEEERLAALGTAVEQASAMLAELKLALDYVSAYNLLDTDND